MNIEEKANLVWEKIELCEHRDEEIKLIVELLDQHEQETRQACADEIDNCALYFNREFVKYDSSKLACLNAKL